MYPDLVYRTVLLTRVTRANWWSGLTYLNEISDAAYSILKKVYKDVFDSLEETIETVKASELTNGESCDVINNDDDDVDISIITSKDIYKLIVSFKEFLKELHL